MNRPSHWIIALFAVMGPALWIWGLTEGFGEAPESAAAGPQRARLLSATPEPPAPIEVLLTGKVIDRFGMPIEGARVRVIGHRSAADTGPAGTFEVMVKVSDPGRRLEVSAPGHGTVVARCAPTDLQHLVVQLTPAPPWESAPDVPAAARRNALAGEGFIHDADLRPLAGVVVAALETGDLAVTDEIGRFRIPLAAARVRFAAWHASGRAGAIDAVAPTQNGGLVNLGATSLGAGARIAGTVRMPEGRPAAGAAVLLRTGSLVRRALADDSGGFAVDGLVAGDYVLEVLPHAGALGISQPLRVEGSGRLQSEVDLAAEVQHRVRLVDQARTPHAGGYVVATDAAARRTWAQADADGYAVLRGLSGSELRVAEVRGQDFAVLAVHAVARDGDTTVVTAGS